MNVSIVSIIVIIVSVLSSPSNKKLKLSMMGPTQAEKEKTAPFNELPNFPSNNLQSSSQDHMHPSLKKGKTNS